MSKKFKTLVEETETLIQEETGSDFHPDLHKTLANTHKTAKWTSHSLDEMLAYVEGVGKESKDA